MSAAPERVVGAAARNDRSRKIHEVVAEHLRGQIVRGELSIGDRLPPEEELTDRFGVARTTLREALRVLESQGLIEVRRGRGGGPVVTHPDLEPAASALAVTLQLSGTTLGDLDAARRVIEPHVAGQLARSHTDADVDALTEAVDRASVAAEADDPAQFADAVVGVHETLMARSGNNTMATISLLLRELVTGYYQASVEQVSRSLMRRAVRSYRRLIELIVEGDVEGATSHWSAQMAYTIGHQDADRLLLVYPHPDEDRSPLAPAD